MEYALSFSLEGRELKISLVSRQGKIFTVELVHSFFSRDDSKSEENFDPYKLLEPILKGKRVKTISALPAIDIILRDLHLPMTNSSKIFSVLPFQAEALIPFPPEETLLYPHIDKNKSGSRVFLTAAKKEKLLSHLANLQTFQIDPDQVSTTPHALARWASLSTRQTPFLKVAFLGPAESFFLLLENERILSSKPLSYPGSDLEREIKKADEFLSAKFPESCGSPWLFAGDVQNVPLGLFPTISLDERFAQQASYALAIGLGMEALATDKRSIQWRQGSFSSTHQQKNQKKYLLYTSLTLICACLGLGPLGHLICNKFENNLLERAGTYVQRIAPEKKALAKDRIWDHESAGLVLDSCMLSLKKEEKLGTFAPKVADLLAWLSACSLEEEGKTRASLTSLDYLLTPNGRVDVRLTIEAAPAFAESFLKKLRQEDSLADKNSEIVWKKDSPSFYSAQFFLKN